MKRSFKVRRRTYQALVGLLLTVIAVLLTGIMWYALYAYVMPSLNSFLFGLAGGANAVTEIDERVAPYTVAALWFIPALCACATLNLLCWQATRQLVRTAKRVAGAAMEKFDKVNPAEGAKK